MAKRNSTRPLNPELNNARDPESITRQSEDPALDATASGNATISDVNQLNAFGGDQPARQETAVESHGEDLNATNDRANESVEAIAGEEASETEESQYNS